ncbi:MAG: DNA cytosine methyltransferase [Deinococcales bacterium]
MRCVDLFAGCGGLSLGFEKAGFEVVAAFDNWQPAIEVYRKNFAHPMIDQDLGCESDASEKIKAFAPDLVMGGPPCQDFSSAGKRDLSQGRAELTYSFANIVCMLKPTWFVMENVERIKGCQVLAKILKQFELVGYGLNPVILDASFCQVPQSRTRFFLIGHLGDEHDRLKTILSKNLAEKAMTVRDYLGESLGLEFYYRHPRNYNRRGVFSIDEPSPTIRGVNRPVPKGYKLNTCDPQGINFDEIRPLSTLERSYLQTFPKNFMFTGTKTNLEQMIGNAVPVNLATYIAKAIQEYISYGAVSALHLFDTKLSYQLPDRPLHRLHR